MTTPEGWPVFFYGLFMDAEILRARGFAPSEPRRAVVSGFALRIGKRATLVRSRDSVVHGALMFMRPNELDRLYADASVQEYRAMPVLAEWDNGKALPALAYVLPVPPEEGESNPEYAIKLRDLCVRLGFPDTYVRSIR
jgi:hypothetical protein